MGGRLAVEYKQSYELIASLEAYNRRYAHKMLELGAGWPSRVNKSIGQELRQKLESFGKDADKAGFLSAECLQPLIHQSPEGQSAGDFLGWLEQLSTGDLYDLLAPYLERIPGNLGELRDHTCPLLREWTEAYFLHLDPAIGAMLASEALTRQAEVANAGLQDLVERLTYGLYLEDPGAEEIWMAPQYHFRPFNLFTQLKGVKVYLYPMEMPAKPGEPTPRLLSLTRALADKNRLRLLHAISTRPQTFTEISKGMRMAKSTMHYHLVLLRAAGLIRMHIPRDCSENERYSLRPGAAQALSQRLSEFLGDH